jgi:hypothetical protein
LGKAIKGGVLSSDISQEPKILADTIRLNERLENLKLVFEVTKRYKDNAMLKRFVFTQDEFFNPTLHWRVVQEFLLRDCQQSEGMESITSVNMGTWRLSMNRIGVPWSRKP